MDHREIETEFEDVLQNLEFAIVTVDRASDDLTDLEILDALDYLIRAYTAEGNGFSAPYVRLSPLKREIAESVEAVAEWRMGRTAEPTSFGALPPSGTEALEGTPSEELVATDSQDLSEADATSVALDDIVACLKRIRRSVKHWNGSNGRRGYLDYVRNFIR